MDIASQLLCSYKSDSTLVTLAWETRATHTYETERVPQGHCLSPRLNLDTDTETRLTERLRESQRQTRYRKKPQ